MSPDRQAGPPPELRRGVDQFNRGEYFECHETLEDLWRRESGPSRELYQGIIQLAVALHHVRGGNHKGAVSMLDKAIPRLERFQPHCTGIAVAELVVQARRCRKTVQSLGPEGIQRYPWAEAPTITFVADPP